MGTRKCQTSSGHTQINANVKCGDFGKHPTLSGDKTALKYTLNGDLTWTNLTFIVGTHMILYHLAYGVNPLPPCMLHQDYICA